MVPEEKLLCYQLTLSGWRGDTSDTDHLIKWVAAPDAEALKSSFSAHRWDVVQIEILPLGWADFGFGLDMMILPMARE